MVQYLSIIIEGKTMKFGIEVEGKFKGIKTLFTSANELKNLSDVLKHCSENLLKDVEQLYISDHENTLDLTEMGEVLKYTKLFNLVTVEVTKCTEHSDKIHVMLVIDSPSFWNLNSNDHIKFSRDHYVFATQRKDLEVTIPEDFAGDIEIELK